MKKVYGVRICQQCRGICHEGSLRTTFGQRKRYFCSERCWDLYIGTDAWTWPEADEDRARRLENYERVEVITA